MNLKGFISITGKPGLYKVVGQAKDRLIVESLIDGKRMPAFASQRISALDDITMYTDEDDVPLGDIIQKIYEKENGGVCINAGDDASKLHAYFAEILPNYDKERVYNSDLKKLFAWYNLLQSTGSFEKIIAEEKEAEAKRKEEEKAEKPAKKEKKEEGDSASEEKPKAEKKPAKKTAAKTGDKKTKTAVKPGMKAESKSKSAAGKKVTAPKRGA